MARFVRRAEAPQYSDYRRYKPLLRMDFRYLCAYCEVSEGYKRGHGAFGVDHYRPKKHFPHLDCEYSNLYYCCNECNWHKGASWPNEIQLGRGYYFPDPCAADPYVDDLLEDRDGVLAARTAAGEYAIEMIRLNREPLLRFRRRRIACAERLASYRELAKSIEMPESVRGWIQLALDHIEAEWNDCFG